MIPDVISRLTAIEAQATANGFLFDRMPDRYLAVEPRLDSAAQVWRVKVVLTYPFNWSFSCVAHPFFSLGALAPDTDYTPSAPDAGARLRDAYLKEWADYQSEPELLRAFDLSQPLGLLHSALTFYKYVLPGLEPKAKAEMENMVGFYLRLILNTAPRA